MARYQTLNLTQVLGVTGVSVATSLTITATGNSQEFNEFAIADTAQLYCEVSAFTGAPTFTIQLQQKNPATGNWVNIGASPQFSPTATTGTTPLAVTLDPVYASCVRAVWTVTGGTSPSVTFSLVAVLKTRT